MSADKAPSTEKRERILRLLAGRLYDWKQPDLSLGIGPHDPGPFDEFHDRLKTILETTRKDIDTFSTAELDAVNRPDAPEKMREWRRNTLIKFENLRNAEPAWYAGGFGHPDHRADFEYWARMSKFTWDELTCLSLGIEPGTFKREEIARLKKIDVSKLPPALRFLLRRDDQIAREFGYHSILPESFLLWAGEVDLDAPADFLRLLSRFHGTTKQPDDADRHVTPAGSKSDRREIVSLAKLLTALAIDAYGYVPSAKRSPIPKEIADMVASLGMSMSDDTVRKYLQLGASHLPPDWKRPDS